MTLVISVKPQGFCYLVVLDGLSQGFHLNSLIQLVFMQQVNEIIQRALMEAHFRVECSHALKNLHAAAIQSPRTRTDGAILLQYHSNRS